MFGNGRAIKDHKDYQLLVVKFSLFDVKEGNCLPIKSSYYINIYPRKIR